MRGVLTLALCAAVLGGCGGGKSEHTKFLEQADAVCGKWGAVLLQIPQPPDPTAPAQVAPYLQRFVPLLTAQNAELGRHVPPAKDAPDMKLFLKAQAAQATFAGRAGAAARRGNQQQMQLELRRWQAAIAQARQIGARLGFSVCSGAPSRAH